MKIPRSTVTKSATVFAVAIAMVAFFGITPANAAAVPTPTVTPASAAPLTTAQVNQGYADMVASSYPRSTFVENGVSLVSFTLPHGATLLFHPSASAAARSPLAVQPDLSVGGDVPYMWVELNRADQAYLVAGGASALGVALCAIPVGGWLLCGAIVGILATAAAYLAAHGFCPSSKPNLRIYTSFKTICEKN